MPRGRTDFAPTAETIAKAQEARKAAREARAQLNLKTDWPDEAIWEKLAKHAGTRLPQKQMPVTAKGIRKVLSTLDFPITDFYDWWGVKKVEDAVKKLQPNWTMRAVAGIILEHMYTAEYSKLCSK